MADICTDEFGRAILERVSSVLRRQKDRLGTTFPAIAEATGLSSSTVIRVLNSGDTSAVNMARIVASLGMTQRDFWARVERKSVSTEGLVEQIQIAKQRLEDSVEFAEEALAELAEFKDI